MVKSVSWIPDCINGDGGFTDSGGEGVANGSIVSRLESQTFGTPNVSLDSLTSSVGVVDIVTVEGNVGGMVLSTAESAEILLKLYKYVKLESKKFQHGPETDE